MSNFKLLAFILLLLSHTICINYSHADGQELNIHSDNLDIDKENGTAVFSGDVTVVFQDMVLKTEKIKVTYVKNHSKDKIDKIIFPTKLRAIKNCGKEMAVANKGNFDAQDGTLRLYGDVILKQDNKILITPTLIYHTTLKLNKK